MSITLGSTYTQRVMRYAAWRAALAARVSIHQHDAEDPSFYFCWFYDGPDVFICRVYRGAVPDQELQLGYTQMMADADLADFEATLLPSSNSAHIKRTGDGRVRIASEKSSRSKFTLYTHDWCAPSTWFTHAVRVVGEVPAVVTPLLVYQLAHVNVIDTYHGRITGEDYLLDAGSNSYRVVVTVNAVPVVEVDPHTVVGDFVIDYATGLLTFGVALAPGAVVEVTYHYATDSEFFLTPDPGKAIDISIAEVQFADDVGMTDAILFQVYAGGVPYGEPQVYKTIRDLQNDSLRAYPVYPPIGGAGWRGVSQTTIIFNWDYVDITPLRSSYGMSISIKLQHDVAFTGSWATATFYGSSEDE
jgi:hypothetical protein